MDWNYHKKTYPSDSGISASFGPLLHILNHHWHFLQTHLQNSTKSKWRLSSMHSGTLSLSHCKMLRISGESVSNHHGQINDSNTKQEDARRCKKIMHISKWDLLIYTLVQTQPRQSGYCQACTQERYRCLTARCSESAGKAFQIITGKSTTQTPSKKMQEDHAYLEMGFDHLHTGANSTKTRWIVSSMHSGTLPLSHCKMLRISGESVSNHHGQINNSNTKQEDARRSCISRNGIAHLYTGANSTKTKWILSSVHSGTLSLSHCKMLRISGESVSNHHGQINDSNTKQEDARRSCISRNGICSFTHRCKLNQDKVNSVKHALRNAIVVSLQDAQNQRGKRFKSSRANQRLKHQARRCKKIMHISKWDLIIYTPVQTQPRQGE